MFSFIWRRNFIYNRLTDRQFFVIIIIIMGGFITLLGFVPKFEMARLRKKNALRSIKFVPVDKYLESKYIIKTIFLSALREIVYTFWNVQYIIRSSRCLTNQMAAAAQIHKKIVVKYSLCFQMHNECQCQHLRYISNN